jgi:hypothetical protein
LLPSVLCLPYRFLLSDVIMSELIEPPGSLFASLGYEIFSIPSDGVMEFFRLRSLYLKPSTNDLFALVGTRTMQGVLITGDNALRKAAESEGLAVHGTLWLLDQLVGLFVITKNEASSACWTMERDFRTANARCASGNGQPDDEKREYKTCEVFFSAQKPFRVFPVSVVQNA